MCMKGDYQSLLFLFCLNKVKLPRAGFKVAVVLTEKLGEEIGVRPSLFCFDGDVI